MSSAPPPRALSEWLQLMLAEIARKRDDLERARAEEARRMEERGAAPPADSADSAHGADSHAAPR
jgi:hypothetical protein